MNVISQTIKLESGDSINIVLPSGHEMTVGINKEGEEIIYTTSADLCEERGFYFKKNGKLKEFELQ